MYGIVLGFTDYVNNISGPIDRCYVADSVPNLISMVDKLRDDYMSKGYKVQRNMQAEEIVDVEQMFYGDELVPVDMRD